MAYARSAASAVLFAVIATGCGGPPQTAGPCMSDRECRGDRICHDGRCRFEQEVRDELAGRRHAIETGGDLPVDAGTDAAAPTTTTDAGSPAAPERELAMF